MTGEPTTRRRRWRKKKLFAAAAASLLLVGTTIADWENPPLRAIFDLIIAAVLTFIEVLAV